MSRTAAPRALDHLLIQASAGSGKTYRLTSRYLELVQRCVPLEQILATTFTRKAAGEILQRVLTRTAAAADDEQKRHELAASIGCAPQTLDRAACLELLARLARHLHRLRIGTLDSLFGQVARAFALEMNLPPGWTIADDAEQLALRTDAIAELLATRDTSDVTRLMHLLAKGANEQSVVSLIDQAVRDLYGLYQSTTREAWHRLPHRATLDTAALERAIEMLAALPPSSDKRVETAREKDLAVALRGEWETFLSKGLAARVLSGDHTYYKKPLPDDLIAAYQTLVDHASAVLLNRFAAQTEGTYELLARFDEHFTRLQHARRLLRFEDITRRLGEWTTALAGEVDGSSRELDLLAFRLDAHIHHLLLDEFQDTSLAQWQVLRPIAQHVTTRQRSRKGDASDSASFFCVGDPKQAIYAWRGGMAEIFSALKQELPGLKDDLLTTSYRSSPAVIQAVNQLFRDAPQRLTIERGAAAFAEWCREFPEHSTAKQDLPGYVTLETPPATVSDGEDDDAESGDPVFEYAADRIAELARQAPGHSIGVLMRSNVGIARMIHLLRLRQVPASEEGGNPPVDSAAVQLFASALRLADHPGDGVARFHLVHSPLGESLGLDVSDDDDAAAAASTRIRRMLLAQGYGAVFERWKRVLAPHVSARDARRLDQVTELAYRRQGDLTLRPSDFASILELSRMSDASLVDVRVTTIHQAKGLEYDIVVLPELKTKLCGQPDSIAVGRSQVAGPIDTVCRYVGAELRPLLPPRFQRLFEDQENHEVVESMCVLYVAVTRAVHALHVIVAASSPSEKKLPGTFAGVLRAGLTDGAPLLTDPAAPVGVRQFWYEQGDPDWAATLRRRQQASRPGPAGRGASERKKAGRVEAEPADLAEQRSSGDSVGGAIRLREPDGPRQRGLERVAPSTLEGGDTRRLKDSMRLEPSRGRQRGTLVHAWCEQIEWLDDGLPSDEVLRDVARQTLDVAWSEEELGELQEQFREQLAAPEITRCLSRSTYRDAEVETRREHPFAVRQGDELMTGVIDRLVLTRQQGRLVAAEILDFKTDAIEAGDAAALAQRVEFYRPQMMAYRAAIAQAYGLAVSSVKLRLLMLTVGRVVELK